MSATTCVIRVTRTAKEGNDRLAKQLRMRPPHVYDVLLRLWKQSTEEQRLNAVAAHSGLVTPKGTGGVA